MEQQIIELIRHGLLQTFLKKHLPQLNVPVAEQTHTHSIAQTHTQSSVRATIPTFDDFLAFARALCPTPAALHGSLSAVLCSLLAPGEWWVGEAPQCANELQPYWQHMRSMSESAALRWQVQLRTEALRSLSWLQAAGRTPPKHIKAFVRDGAKLLTWARLKDADAERWVTDVFRNALSGNRCMVFCRRLRQMANEAGMDAAAAVMQNADFIVEMRKELTEGDIGKPKLSGKPTPNPTQKATEKATQKLASEAFIIKKNSKTQICADANQSASNAVETRLSTAAQQIHCPNRVDEFRPTYVRSVVKAKVCQRTMYGSRKSCVQKRISFDESFPVAAKSPPKTGLYRRLSVDYDPAEKPYGVLVMGTPRPAEKRG